MRSAFLLLFLCATGASAQDTLVIQSRGAGTWRSPRIVEDLRIGVLEGDDKYIFGSVAAMTVTRDGSIFVADGQGPRMRLYDARGKFVRDVFRSGSGPGEYKGVMGLATTEDDRVALWDLPNARVNLYRANGDYISQFGATGGWWGDDNFMVDSAGRFWVFTNITERRCIRTVTMPDGSRQEIGSEAPGCNRPVYMRFTAQGAPIDTLPAPTFPVAERTPSFVLMSSEGAMEPFVMQYDRALSPHGYFVTIHSSRYAVNIPNGPGGRVRQVVRPHTPVRLTADEKNEWEARAAFYDRRGGASAGVKISAVKPVLREVMVDLDGRIWVDRYVTAVKRTDLPPRSGTNLPPAITWREPRTFDVFEPDGDFLGTVVAPRHTTIWLAKDNLLWGTVRGEFDETYVVRLRLVTN